MNYIAFYIIDGYNTINKRSVFIRGFKKEKIKRFFQISMGCGASVMSAPVVPNDTNLTNTINNNNNNNNNKQSSNATSVITNNGLKSVIGGPKPYNPPPLVAAKTQWKEFNKVSPLKKQVTMLCSTPDEHELKEILDDPIGQKYLGNYAKNAHNEETLYCFVEIFDYICAPSSSYRKSIAQHIYRKYIRENSIMALGGLSNTMVAEYHNKILLASNNYTLFTDDFFYTIQKMCFTDLCLNTFVRFKKSNEYKTYKAEMKNTYNKVTVEDFEYLDVLGSGGFGRVVHARKKSTGKHYAMKIQLKTALLDEYASDLSQITTEKVILEACNHSYIVEMHYAFQTPEHAIVVLGYVRGGDLSEALKNSPDWRLPEDQVRLYVAEIALALNHLHEMGILYRDLKPGNVLLGEDGHIKLADMGLATTAETITHKRLTPEMFHNNRYTNKSYTFRQRNSLTLENNIIQENDFIENIEQEKSVHASSNNSTNVTEKPNISSLPSISGAELGMPTLAARRARRKTTVGTKGYMAPELLRGKLKRREERKGYNLSVDYWALGITMFELLCGHQPFDYRNPIAEMFGEVEEFSNNPKKQAEQELEKMNKKIEFTVPTISEEAKDFVCKLLDLNEETRLGCTDLGFSEIMNHPFFNTIDWDKLVVKHVEPAYKPNLKSINEKKRYANYEQMLASFNFKEANGNGLSNSKYNWMVKPKDKDQIHFETWDYVSTNTLKAELGIAIEMDESNRPYKVLQLTGQIPNSS